MDNRTATFWNTSALVLFSIKPNNDAALNWTAACPPITPSELIATQVPTIITGTIVTSTQLFNLLIFALWRNKEPYILLHVSLAVASLVGGISVFVSVPLRYITLTAGNLFLTKLLCVALVSYASFASHLANVAISLDRWLSVEFAIRYRTAITSRKVAIVGVVGVFGGALLVNGPGILVFWQFITVDPCTRRKNMEGTGTDWVVWDTTQEILFLPILFASQLRILWIALSLKLQQLRRRNRNLRVSVAPLQGRVENHLPSRLVWGSLLGSMAIVCITLLANVPSVSLNYVPVTPVSRSLRRPMAYLTYIQHCSSLLIYMLFWPDYRNTLLRFFRRLRAFLG
ncbi:hypothetical protein BV898_02162 [Hypsibius exemplaris]|uniref:G-protein coupled receptors family 1 profile domain-containing protein n=1 Tax=Hypsibius exemplaris TaxID=2072580 RepID=A0A1W0X8V2_HYPEX|nr:hypothetical protein BV898_02162 [Hypsibius exemplaris]